MKRIAIFGMIAAISGCVGGVGSACGGCVSSKIEEEVEKKTGSGGTQEMDPENYRLTDRDVKKLARDLPRIADEFEELGRIAASAPTQPGKMFAGLVGSEKLNARLKAMGWNPPEKFFVVYAQTLQAYAFIGLDEITSEIPGDLGDAKAQMEEMLKNPNIPPGQKKEIRKQIKEMERQMAEYEREMKELKSNEVLQHNIKVVRRHQKELEKAFESLD